MYDGAVCSHCGAGANQRGVTTSPGLRTSSVSLSPVERFVASPASFGVVFALGLVVSFAVGVAVLWPHYDPAALLKEGRTNDALRVIAASSSPSASWLSVKGQALHAQGQLEPMLLAFQAASAGGAADDIALQHTLEALGDAAAGSLAVKTLEDWPGDVDAALLALTSDPSRQRRHKALEALQLRHETPAPLRLEAAIRVAVTDTAADDCADKFAAIKALNGWSDDAAAQPILKKLRAWDAVFSQDNDVVYYKFKCLEPSVVKRTVAALAKVAN
jgi:hypothetical protein